jgi:hypothetical protein
MNVNLNIPQYTTDTFNSTILSKSKRRILYFLFLRPSKQRLGFGLDDQESEFDPLKVKFLSLLHRIKVSSGTSQFTYEMLLALRSKPAVCKAERSHSAEVNYVRSRTFTSPYFFMWWCLIMHSSSTSSVVKGRYLDII